MTRYIGKNAQTAKIARKKSAKIAAAKKKNENASKNAKLKKETSIKEIAKRTTKKRVIKKTRSTPKPDKGELRRQLRRHEITCTPVEINLLWKFHNFLRNNNTDSDLTRLHAFDTMVEKHYADCLILRRFEHHWPKRMLDIGTGAGFPGIPLKIVLPRVHFTLCEPRKRRADFLQEAVEKLGLKKVQVFPHKVTSASMDIPVDGIITRAFEKMEKTLLRVENSLAVGGRAYFMKGPAVDAELKEFSMDGYKIERVHRYTIPNSEQDRVLVIIRRNK